MKFKVHLDISVRGVTDCIKDKHTGQKHGFPFPCIKLRADLLPIQPLSSNYFPQTLPETNWLRR